ncbi:hypothetical protein [Undibacterium flavidum]|uniref:Uncharacterized protein n=1 Tax=Undibacterium flavidum TaxID=2762297 RepID=A0ABR6YAY2_9BURK|nr:hypothetical protein [Undibacterium flavidum]MBC3873784.1 hypothetical protein [Undibacterium flavidum]
MSIKVLLINLPQFELGQRLSCVGSESKSRAVLWRKSDELRNEGFEVEIVDAESRALNFFTIVRAIRRRAPEYVLFYQASTCSGSLPSSSKSFVGVLCRHVHERMPGLRLDLLIE